jgi:hypothetical protein
MFLSDIKVGVWGISIFDGMTSEEQSNLGAFIWREPVKINAMSSQARKRDFIYLIY